MYRMLHATNLAISCKGYEPSDAHIVIYNCIGIYKSIPAYASSVNLNSGADMNWIFIYYRAFYRCGLTNGRCIAQF